MSPGKSICMLIAGGLMMAPTVAQAGWRDDLGTFRIGMLADPGTGRVVAGVSEIEQAFSDALGMPVKIFVARDYAALIDAQATSRIEYAIYSAIAYATAQRLCNCLEPLVAKRGADDDTGMRSVLLLRKSAMENAGGVGNLKIAIAQGDSVSSALLPAWALAGSGGPEGIGSDQFVITAGDTDAQQMFAAGAVDGLFGWALAREDGGNVTGSGTFGGLTGLGVKSSELQLYWASEPLRYGPHALRSDVDAEVADILGEFLKGLSGNKPDIQELLAGSMDSVFIETKPDDYRLALELVDRSGGSK